MKSFLNKTLKSLILGGLILLGVGFISAEYAPPPGDPLAGDPPPLVDVGIENQAKSGTLKIGDGQVAGPGIAFDNLGIALTTSAAIFGDGEISETLYVGTRDADPATFPKEPVTVAVDGETIVDNLSGMGIIPVCADPDGKLRPCFVHPNVVVYPQCSDQIDNDGDGLVDYPNDPGCTTASDTDETDPQPGAPECSDGVDNDNDGAIDFPTDWSCESPLDNSESGPSVYECSDGIDNDGDGIIDYPNDLGCESFIDDVEDDAVTFLCNPVPSNVPFTMNIGDTVCVDGIHELTLIGTQLYTNCPSNATCYDDWVFLYTDPATGQTQTYSVPNNSSFESESVIFDAKFGYDRSIGQFLVQNGL